MPTSSFSDPSAAPYILNTPMRLRKCVKGQEPSRQSAQLNAASDRLQALMATCFGRMRGVMCHTWEHGLDTDTDAETNAHPLDGFRHSFYFTVSVY